MRRGYSHIQEKCSGSAATLSAHRRRERYAVRHAVNSKRLNKRIIVRVAPYAARVAPNQFLIRGAVRTAVEIGPLSNDVFTVGRFYDRIAGPIPYRDFRPWPAMSGCCPHAIAKGLRGLSVLREHGLECLLNVAGALIRQSGNDGAASKHLRVCCEHHRSHGTAGREAGHECFAAVSSKCRNGVLDHLSDRKRLALAAHDVVRQKPRETIMRIVGGLLLRIDDREPEVVGER